MKTAVTRSGIAKVSGDLLRHGSPFSSPAVLVEAVGTADESFQLEGGWISQPQEPVHPGFGSFQDSILQIRADGAKGQRVNALCPDLFCADGSDVQNGRAEEPGNRVGQFDLIEFLVASQADQQGLLDSILQTGKQHQQLDGLAGIKRI